MNLAALTALVCEKINMQQTVDLAACRNWFTRRHELIWNESLFKDALVQYTQVLEPTGYTVASTWLPSKGVLLCPPIIGQVIAARLDANRMNVQRQEYYYRINYDSFAQSGNATEFVVLPKCVWELDSAQLLQISFPDAGDSAATATLDTLDQNTIDVTRNVYETNDQFTTERIDTFSKLTTTGDCDLYQASAVDTTGVVYVPGFPTQAVLPVTAGVIYSITPGVNEDGATLVNGATNVNLGTDTVVVTAETGFLYFQGTPVSGLNLTATVFTLTSILTMTPTETNVPWRQRIRLVFKPAQETTIRVLGKRICPEFDSDNDEPAIPAMTNCLIDFVHADMLERARRYGQAQAKQAEGMALLDQLKRVETVQQAHEVHLEPEEGLGGQWRFNDGTWSWNFW